MSIKKTVIKETEYKGELTKERAESMQLDRQTEKTLYNYYFVTPVVKDFIRIRREGERFELTFKAHFKTTGHVTESSESTIEISEEEAVGYLESGIPEKIVAELTGQKGGRAEYAAQNKTLRREGFIKDVPVSIDKCSYYGETVYEIECEDINKLGKIEELIKGSVTDGKIPGSKAMRTLRAELTYTFKTLECVLFDLDGTVLKTDEAIIPSLKKTFEIMGGEAGDDYSRFIGPPLAETMSKIFGDPVKAKEGMELYLKIYNDADAESRIRPYSGIPELFKELREAGLKVGIATSKGQKVAESCLKRTGVQADFVVGSDEKLNIRKKADILNRAIEVHFLEKERCILIGDTFYDMAGAEKAGIQAAAVTYGYGRKGEMMLYPHMFTAESPAETGRRIKERRQGIEKYRL